MMARATEFAFIEWKATTHYNHLAGTFIATEGQWPTISWRFANYKNVQLNMIVAVTNLGDAALLAPASFILLLLLFWHKDSSRAVSLAIAIGACLTFTILAKLFVLMSGLHCLSSGLQSPSGHASFSATFYGCCARLTAPAETTWKRRFIWIAALGLILVIAVSRVIVGAHSLPEVIIGLFIGSVCLGVFIRLTEMPRAGPKFLQLALGIVVLAIVVQGSHLTLEPLLRAFADRFGFVENSKCSISAVSPS